MSSAAVATTTPAAAPAAQAVPKDTKKQANVSVISHARVRRHIDKLGVNKLVTLATRKIKEELKPLDEAQHRLDNGDRKVDAEGKATKSAEGKPEYTPLSDAEKAKLQKLLADTKARYDELTKEQGALGRERTRFSTESSMALAVVLDELIRQLVTHAMDNVIGEDKKIIQVNHLRDGASKLDLFPLVHALPSWHTVPDHVIKKKKEEGDAEVEVPVAATEPESEHSDKTSFSFYVSSICRGIIFDGTETVTDADGKVTTKPKKSEKYGNIRVSTNIREYCNLLLIEFIHRLSVQLQETLKNQDVKTVTDDIIMDELRKMLIDGQEPSEKLVYTMEDVPDPAAIEANKKLAKAPADAKAAVAGVAYRKALNQLPTVKQLVVRKQLDYSGTRYGNIAALVNKKMNETAGKKADAPKAAPAVLKEFALPAKPAPAPPAPKAEAPAAPAPAAPKQDAAAPAAPAAAPAKKAAAKAAKPAAPKAPKAKAAPKGDAPAKPKVARAKKAAAQATA